MSSGFFSQEVTLTENRGIIIFPDGYENLFLAIYAVIIPLLVGYLFLYTIILNAGLDIFKGMEAISDSFILIWIIGYEVSATLTLTYLLFSFFSFSPSDKDDNSFVIP